MPEDSFIIKIYKFATILIRSLQEIEQDDVKSELLWFGLTLEGQEDAYIFVCMRNRKYQMLRGELKKARVISNGCEPDSISTEETKWVDDGLDILADLDILYRAFFHMTNTQAKYVFQAVKAAKKGKSLIVRNISYNAGFGMDRGNEVLRQIRKDLNAERAKKTKYEDGIEDIGDLHKRLLKLRTGGRLIRSGVQKGRFKYRSQG